MAKPAQRFDANPRFFDLDRITYRNEDDLALVHAWAGDHEAEVRNFNFTLFRGVIHYFEKRIVFRSDERGETVTIRIYDEDGRFMYGFDLDRTTLSVSDRVYNQEHFMGSMKAGWSLDRYLAELDHLLQGDVEIYTFTMAYMASCSPTHVTVHKEDLAKPTSPAKSTKKKGKAGAQNQSHSVKLASRLVFDLSPAPQSSVESGTKPERVWHTDCWTVRGHWRRVSDDRKVWVKSHLKGEGKFDKKEYLA